MNKNIIYTAIAALAIGLLGGYLIFKNSANEQMAVKDTSDMSDSHDHSNESEAQMWTCSMHPQIMQPEPGDCPICGMDLIPAESGADGLTADQFKMTENALALANIHTTKVGMGATDGGSLKLSGKIRENEEANAVQVTYFAGRIEKLYVNYEGETVAKGKLLAMIYSPELVSAQQELLTASSLKESQPQLYKAVRNKLKLWKLSEAQIDKIEQSGTTMENFPVYATVSGTVTNIMVEEGDYVKQGQPLYKIANLNNVWAVFDAYENQIASLKEGQEVKVTTNAYPNEEFTATVSFVDPLLNSKTRTVMVRGVLDNKDNLLKPGMFVEGTIKGSKITEENTLAVPASAVMWTGERSVVYVKPDADKSIFEMREVTLGSQAGDVYTIVNGLEPGDEVVTNGTFTVDAAAQLKGKKSMMNKEGGKTMTGHEGHAGMQGNDQAASGSKTDHSKMNERMDVDKTFQSQLNGVFEAYLALKNALVADDPEGAQSSAKNVSSNLEKVDMKLLDKENAHNHWMTLQKEMKSSADAIGSTSTITEQRDHFNHLSSHMIGSIQLFGVGKKVFKQFCPMANNNNGAYWLSAVEEIRNPYYGDAMLTCGEIRETIE